MTDTTGPLPPYLTPYVREAIELGYREPGEIMTYATSRVRRVCESFLYGDAAHRNAVCSEISRLIIEKVRNPK